MSKPNVRRKYTKEFKLKVVKEHLEGLSLTELSKIYGIAPSTLGTWFATLKSEVMEEVNEEAKEVDTVVDSDILKELEQLRQRNKVLEERVLEKDNDIQRLTDLLNKGGNRVLEADEKDKEIERLEKHVQELHQALATVREDFRRDLNVFKEALILLATSEKE